MTRRTPRLLALVALVAAAACAGPRQAAGPGAPPSVATAPAAPDRTTPPEKGPAPELRLPEQRHFTLSNGLRVRLVEYRRLPIVALNLVADAGGARDPGARPGLASFTAAMLTEGTQTRSATQISDEVGYLGASLSAGAGLDSASLGGATLAKHLPRFLELFADVAMNPAFPRGDFERVQDERLVALLQQRDQPQAIASKAFAPVFWGDHPYGHYLLGTEESVQATTPKELAGFHERHWRPGSAELVVVGDVTEAELRPVLESTLARWKPAPPPAPLAPAAPVAPKRTLLLEKPDAPQAYLLLGMPGLQRSSDEFVAASVAFQVLGGGMSSRLFRNLREDKGYTYGIFARGDSRRLAGMSVIVGSVHAEVTGAALAELLSEIRQLREEPIGDEELEDAKNALVLGLPANFATAGAIAGRVADLAVHGLPDDYWNRYADLVRQVTAEDVRRFAQQRLDPGQLTVVMVANPEVVKPQLVDLPIGPIEVRAASPAPAAGTAPPAPAKGVAR
jgi:zinc protease